MAIETELAANPNGVAIFQSLLASTGTVVEFHKILVESEAQAQQRSQCHI